MGWKGFGGQMESENRGNGLMVVHTEFQELDQKEI